MATIPLPDIPATPGAPQPVLAPRKQMQVDFRSAFAAQREAAVQPLMPEGMFDMGEAQAAWGKTLMALGQTGMSMAKDWQGMLDKKGSLEADEEFTTTSTSQLNKLQAESPPSEWVPKYQEFITKERDRILDSLRLSSTARDEVALRLTKMGNDTVTRLAATAMQTEVQQTRDRYTGRIGQYVNAGQFANALATNQEMTSLGLQSEVDASVAASAIIRQEHASIMQADLKRDPLQLYRHLQLPQGERPEHLRDIPEGLREPLSNQALAQSFVRRGAAVERFKYELASLAITTKEQVEQFARHPDRAGILEQEDFNLMMGMLQNTLPRNTSSQWSAAYSAINSLDLNVREDEWRLQSANLERQFEGSFDGPMLAEVKDMLKKRIEQRNDLEAWDRRDLMALGEQELERGSFGPLTRPKTNAAGERLVETKTELVVPHAVPRSPLATGFAYYNPMRPGVIPMRRGTLEDATERTSKSYMTEPDLQAREMARNRMKTTLTEVDKWAAEAKIRPNRDERVKKFYEILGTSVNAAEAAAYTLPGTSPPPPTARPAYTPAPDAAANLKQMLPK